MGFEELKTTINGKTGLRIIRIKSNLFEELVKSDLEEIEPPTFNEEELI